VYKRKATEERRKAKALMLLMCGCRNMATLGTRVDSRTRVFASGASNTGNSHCDFE